MVIVIADSDGLAPTGMLQARLRGDVGKRAVTIVLEQMGGRSLPGGKTFQARTIHQENVEPAVTVVIVESHAAAGRLQQIFIFVFSAKNRFEIESGFASDVDETNVQAVRGGGRLFFCSTDCWMWGASLLGLFPWP